MIVMFKDLNFFFLGRTRLVLVVIIKTTSVTELKPVAPGEAQPRTQETCVGVTRNSGRNEK